MLSSPHDIKQHLLTIIFNDEPTIKDLFSVVVVCSPLVHRLLHHQGHHPTIDSQ